MDYPATTEGLTEQLSLEQHNLLLYNSWATELHLHVEGRNRGRDVESVLAYSNDVEGRSRLLADALGYLVRTSDRSIHDGPIWSKVWITSL